MKRPLVHAGFTALTLCIAAIATWQWLDLRRSMSVIHALETPQDLLATVDDHTKMGLTDGAELRLSLANALSASGNFEAAESAFNSLIRQYDFNTVGQSARFNLANAYLRQGMRSDLPGNRTRPMLELAKQRYRDLLRLEPDDWDARYNLELALRLAPENSDIMKNKKGEPIKRVRVVVPDFLMKDLP